MSFWGEIKRRKVFQVAAVYAVVAWLLIQVVDVIGEPLTLPNWINAVVIVLLAVGFPIAVILAWVVDMTPSGPEIDRGSPHDEASAPLSGQRVGFAIQGLVLVAVALLVVDQYFLDGSTPAENVDTEASAATPDDTRVRRWTVNLGKTTARVGLGAEVAVSPNGNRIVYSVRSTDDRPLYSYLDHLDPQPIPRTENARQPFFSPTSEWIGFVAGRGPRSQFIRAPIRGGPPETLTDYFYRIYGASWEHDDSIIFSTTDGMTVNVAFLVRVSASGGWLPDRLTTPEPGTSHLFPDVLPGSKAALFTVRLLPGAATESSIALLDLETGEHRMLLRGGV